MYFVIFLFLYKYLLNLVIEKISTFPILIFSTKFNSTKFTSVKTASPTSLAMTMRLQLYA
eukprot:SAG11_NODE_5650_length_1496_cov_1.579814_2_plen_60_part_00